ncbi:hypothetical protein [Muricoccus aerilatus]|nr:hypothetical protein [Roseomonas aerilata]
MTPQESPPPSGAGFRAALVLSAVLWLLIALMVRTLLAVLP